MAWVQAAVMAAAAIAGAWSSHKASKEMKKLSPQEREMFKVMLDSAKKNASTADWLMQFAKDPIVQHSRNLNAAASGDRESLMRQTMIERSQMSKGAQQAMQNMAQMGPRTGAQSAALNAMPFNLAQQQQQLISGRKQHAQDQLGPWGMQMAQMAGGLRSNSSQGAGNVVNIGMQRNRDAFDAGQQTGAGTYNMLMNLFGAYNAGRNKGSTNPWDAGQFWGGGTTVNTPAGPYDPAKMWGGSNG